MPRLMPIPYISVILVTVQSEVSFRGVMLCILAYTDSLKETVISVIRED